MEKSNVEKVAEEVIEENKRLKMKLDDRNCKIKEMQHHIDCLEADKSELRKRCKDSARDNFDNHLYGLLNIVGSEGLHPKFELPTEPIKLAMMLIDAGYAYQNTNTGMQHRGSLYSKSDLRQIAEHLLVYCNNTEE